MATRTFQLPDGRTITGRPVGFQPIVEYFNEYLTDDGVTVKVKHVVTHVLEIEGEKDALGNPTYAVFTQNVYAVDAPDDRRDPLF